jgi:hypothetical protein
MRTRPRRRCPDNLKAIGTSGNIILSAEAGVNQMTMEKVCRINTRA